MSVQGVKVVPANYDYKTVAASQTAQVLGLAGAAGDIIQSVLIVPATNDAGNVLLLDGAISITLFAGGTGALDNLKPFVLNLNMRSVSGAWKITTGASVSVVAIGRFT